MNALEKLQHQLYQEYESSSISHFMRWWKTQLKSFIPEKYQEKLFSQAIEVWLLQENQTVVIWCNNGNGVSLYAPTDHDNEDLWWHQVQHIMNHADGKQVKVNYLLAHAETLVRKIALPSAAKENLEEVIGFELDKYVPFNPEQVQISHKIDKANKDENKILLDLAVIPKQRLTEIIQMCDEKSIKLDGLDVNLSQFGAEPKNLGVNLLPKEQRKPQDYTNLKWNAGLVLVLFALIYFIMHTSVANKQLKIDKLAEINSQLQQQAKESKLLKKELKNVIVSSKFLQNKKNDYPKIITMLTDITSKLSDSTYLSRMKINQKELEITGLSDNANILIPQLDKSTNWYMPRLYGSISPDPMTNKERFTIKADIKPPQEADDEKS